METPRHPKTEEAYERFKEELQAAKQALDIFDLSQENVVREFTHWVIIQNRFPYDRMVRTNDMLVCKEGIANVYQASEHAQEEYRSIMQTLSDEGFYDAVIENFPKVQSVTKSAHVHLVRWHNTQDAS